MTGWKDRVIDEKAELDSRIVSLEAFLPGDVCMNLPFDERCRLARQRALMKQLSSVLGERIAAFPAHA